MKNFFFNSSPDTGLDTLQASDYSVLVTIFTNQSSYLLLGRTHLTRCHCFHCDNTMNPRLVSVVQNFLVYRVWAATALLPASVYPSRLRYHHSDQQLFINGQTSTGTLKELTWDRWVREHVSHHKASSTCLAGPFCFAPL